MSPTTKTVIEKIRWWLKSWYFKWCLKLNITFKKGMSVMLKSEYCLKLSLYIIGLSLVLVTSVSAEVQSVVMKCPDKKSNSSEEITLYWNENGFTGALRNQSIGGKKMGIEMLDVQSWADMVGDRAEFGPNSRYKEAHDWVVLSTDNGFLEQLIAINRKTGEYWAAKFSLDSSDDGPKKFTKRIDERTCVVSDGLF